MKPIVVAVALAVVAGGCALYFTNTFHLADTLSLKQALAAKSKKSSSSAKSTAIAATVNGDQVSALEVSTSQGNRGFGEALTDYVLKAAIAADYQKEHSTLPPDVESALRWGSRDVLFRAWLANATQEAAKRITDTDVQAYYDEKLPSSAFVEYQVDYYATSDMNDAKNVTQALSTEGADVSPLLAKFKRMSVGEGDKATDYLPAAALPYNFGNVLASMQPGQISQGLTTREGFFFLKLVSRREGKKPALSEVKDSIRQALVQEKLAEKMDAVRKAADIRLQ